MPSLDKLYSESNDFEMNETRWNIFKFITSLNDDEISVIKQLSKNYLLISTILYISVKVKYFFFHSVEFDFNTMYLLLFIESIDQR